MKVSRIYLAGELQSHVEADVFATENTEKSLVFSPLCPLWLNSICLVLRLCNSPDLLGMSHPLLKRGLALEPT